MTLNPFKPFSRYLRPYRTRIAVGLLLLAISQLIGTAIPIIMQWAVDIARTGYEARQSNNVAEMEAALSAVLRYALLIIGLSIVVMGLQMAMRWAFSSMSRFVEYDLRTRYYDRLLTLSLSYFHRMPTGDLMARAVNDIQAIRMFLAFGVRMILTAAMAFPLSLAVMLTIDWRLALYALVPMPLLVVVMNRVASKINVGFREVQEQFSAISARVQESIAGIRVVKAYVQRAPEMETFRALNETYLQKNRALIHIQSLVFPFMFLISGVSLMIVLWIGGEDIIRQELTVGEFVAFNAYLTRLIFPMLTLGWMIDRYQRGVASLRRLDEIMDEKPEIVSPPDAIRPPEIRGHIEFRNLNFSYDNRPVLRNITLDIPAGSTLAVIGRVGSGKTTLARLIPRLIDPPSETLFIDGVPVEKMDLETLRSATGYVPQDTFLFSDTVYENVALGTPDAAPEDVTWATEVSQLSRDLTDFPEGLDTVMGERGVTLSGGQKQRTALARAVIRRPSVLILDDAMASVDTHTEDAILKRLANVMKERTTILIAHRISTVREADHIIVLEDGAIVEQGQHDDLVALNGIYASIYRQQQLREELSEM